MNSWKLLLFQILIIGLMTSVFCSPVDSLDANSEYQNDDDLDEYDDESDQTSSQKQSNKVDLPAAYFKLTNYTEQAKLGETVNLKCDIVNAGANNVIMWYKGIDKPTFIYQNNFRITKEVRYIIQKDHSLTITEVQESDEDVYTCNVLPSNITMQAKLVVLSQLQAHIIQGGRDITDRSITYRQNDRIEVECKASGARSTDVEYIWSANGNRLKSDDNMKIDGGRLVIEKADRDHVRLYQCLADNKADETGHASVTINIQYTPRVTAHRSVINTKAGDNAELYCEFETSTESKVTWRKDKKELPIQHEPRSKYSVIYKQKTPSKNTSILVVSNVKPKDLGEYECQVENDIGSENVSIELTSAPEPPQLHNVEKEGDVVITHWHIRSLQPLTEVMLNYQQKGNTDWLAESPIDQEQSKEHSGLWKIKHKLALAPGHWHVRVKAKNTEGWSTYSTKEDILIEDKKSNTATTLASHLSSAISIVALIYSIHVSTRLFG